MQTELGKKFWISMLVFGLMGQVAWVVENMYFNVFIYKMFHATAADISAMVMASAVTAALTTIIMGAVSDKVGKRKAFMSVGYMIWGLSIITFAYIHSIMLTIVMDCVMTYFGSTANDAAYNAWLTDRGDSTNRGKIEGVNSMMPLVAVLVVFGGFMSFNLDDHSAWVTIYYVIGIATTLIGIALGVLVATIRSSHDKLEEELRPGFGKMIFDFVDKLARIYLTVIRGTPTVVQLMIAYFIIFAASNNKILIAILAFGINSGAYVAEIIRSGIMSVDPGQFEAGRSLGFNYVQTMIHIIIPQAFKAVLPALANEFIVLIKETSVSGYVGLQDLTKGGDIIRSQTYSAFLPLILVAAIYLVIVMFFTKLVSLLEGRLRNSER